MERSKIVGLREPTNHPRRTDADQGTTYRRETPIYGCTEKKVATRRTQLARRSDSATPPPCTKRGSFGSVFSSREKSAENAKPRLNFAFESRPVKEMRKEGRRMHDLLFSMCHREFGSPAICIRPRTSFSVPRVRSGSGMPYCGFRRPARLQFGRSKEPRPHNKKFGTSLHCCTHRMRVLSKTTIH